MSCWVRLCVARTPRTDAHVGWRARAFAAGGVVSVRKFGLEGWRLSLSLGVHEYNERAGRDGMWVWSKHGACKVGISCGQSVSGGVSVQPHCKATNSTRLYLHTGCFYRIVRNDGHSPVGPYLRPPPLSLLMSLCACSLDLPSRRRRGRAPRCSGAAWRLRACWGR